MLSLMHHPRWLGLRTLRHCHRRVPISALVLVILSCLLVPMKSLASESVVDLGKATNALPNEYFPLSGFHHTGKLLTIKGKVELLFIGAQADPFSGMERWPVVMALDNFGTLGHITAVVPPCPVTNMQVCLYSYATYDWSHATYRSQYFAFVHKDVLDLQGHPYQRLSTSEQKLYRRYTGGKPSIDPCSPASTRQLPIVVVGGYVETVSPLVTCRDFSTTTTVGQGTEQIPMSFDAIRSAIIANKASTTSSTAYDVNAEANVITALICHADRLQPARACGRSVIKKILKYVK
jgi:hypothetical protein